MSYQVLARKLRPATFDALVGQEHVVRALRHALDHGRLHHAYLFTGTRGVGKTTIARVLAKCLNCEQGVSSHPCGVCSVCQEVAENRFIDLIEVDAASRTRVDDTRELLENAQYLPTRGRYKVYLIDEVHMLSGASFNALLKTLEEPPAHVVFLLATTDPKKVPVTVLSRCLQFQLKNLSVERISGYLAEVLAEEAIVAEPDALTLVAEAARGSMRDALSITDQAIAFGQGAVRTADVRDMLGLAGRDAVAGLLRALAVRDAAQLLALSAELAERSVDFDDVLAELIGALHRMAVAQALQNGADDADLLAPEEVQLLYQIALLGHRDLAIAPDPRCGFEMTLLRMLAFAPVPEGAVPTGPEGGRRQGSAAPEGAASGQAVGAERQTEVPGGAPATSSAGSNRPGPRLAAVSGRRVAAAGAPAGAAAIAHGAPAVAPVTAWSQAAASGSTGDTASSGVALARDATPAPDHVARDAANDDGAPPECAEAPGADPQDAAARANAAAWFDLVGALGLTGVARMIAQHSELLGQAVGTMQLRLDSAHDTLLADGPVATIGRALTEYLGTATTVRVVVGRTASETPAERIARERIERQAAAAQVLAEDPTVRRLLDEFGGEIEAVSPVE